MEEICPSATFFFLNLTKSRFLSNIFQVSRMLILNFSKSKLYTEDTGGSLIGKPTHVCMVVPL